MAQANLFLVVLFVIGWIAKKHSLMIAVAILALIQLFPFRDSVFGYIESKGINIGVIVITVAVLAPIATGKIGFAQLKDSLTSYAAWIAVVAGILVAIFGKYGVQFLQSDPQMTAALVLGTVLAVAIFQGVAVGPIIGGGIAYVLVKLFESVFK